MGAIIRRGTKDRPRFYLKYIDADGTQRTKAAKGAVNVAHARRMLAEIERNIFNGKLGVEEPTEDEQARRTITVRELGARFLGDVKDVPGYSDPGIKDMASYRAQAKSKLTVRIYPTLGDRPAASLTLSDLKRFRDGLAAKPLELKPASVTLTLAVLSKMFTWAKEEGIIDCANPVKGCKRPRSEASLDYLSKAEIGNLLTHAEAHAPDLHPMIATAVYTGMRKGELFGLRWIDVRLDAAQIDVNRSYRKAPKSGKARHLPMHPALVPILRRWQKRCPTTKEGLVFPVDGEMGTAYDGLGLGDALTAAGCHLPAKPWHSLRHTMASHFMMAGGNILTLQRLLGHSTLTMTMRYAHLAPDFMAAEVARMSFAVTVAGIADLDDARRGRAAQETTTSAGTNLTQQATGQT